MDNWYHYQQFYNPTTANTATTQNVFVGLLKLCWKALHYTAAILLGFAAALLLEPKASVGTILCISILLAGVFHTAFVSLLLFARHLKNNSNSLWLLLYLLLFALTCVLPGWLTYSFVKEYSTGWAALFSLASGGLSFCNYFIGNPKQKK